jgi:uncharacterized surface anchored protein
MRNFLLILILFFSFSTYSQPNKNKGKVTGKVIDSQTKEAVEMAIVSIFKPGETKAINGASTDKNGTFTIDNLPSGTYSISIDFIGYKKKWWKRSTLRLTKPLSI